MDDRKKYAVKLSLLVILAAIIMALFSLIRDTSDSVKIMVKPKENDAALYMDYFIPSSGLIDGWFYSDKIIVAAGNSIRFNASIFKLGGSSVFSGSQKIAIIDVTEDIGSRKIEKSVSFESIIDGSFSVKKGRKYRFALYTMAPDKETEVSIQISGCDKIRSYFLNKKIKESSEPERED